MGWRPARPRVADRGEGTFLVPQCWMVVGLTRDDVPYVFTDKWGAPIFWGHVTDRMLRPLCTKAGLRAIRFHDLRHSAATFLLLQGVADRTVMEILGHTSLAMTSRYMHVLDGLKR